MKKIPTIYARNWDGDRLVRNEITSGCEWVFRGEGDPTRKLDGTACMINEHGLFRRYELKSGKEQPYGFISADKPTDDGSVMGWIPVGDGNRDKWAREGLSNLRQHLHQMDYPREFHGTYELVGPKINGNPERYEHHYLELHGEELITDMPYPLTFEGLRNWLRCHDVEGIVWHHPDGRMAKIKKRDFGLKR